MPFVNIRTAKGLLNDKQKRQLHSRITELLVEVEGRGHPDFSEYVVVLIEEHDPGNWSFHGEPVTKEALESALG
ncbi:MAG: 4-oxalocrotonate tautomerase family protein [Phycisphaerales bacterium]|nr:4-oxalocrotonate tautomerase family protein [Phycisphaerales bacterium]